MKKIAFILFSHILLSGSFFTVSSQDTSYVYKETNNRTLSLYVYYPEGTKPANPLPAVVFYFGGGWVNGDPGHFHQQARYLANRGMIAVTADYRIKSKDGTSPGKSIMDAKSAMRWIKANASKVGVDENKIAAAGGSAGGHLAASTAIINDFNDPNDDVTVSPAPNALILFNPVIDVSARGYGAEKLKKDSLKASPVHHVTSNLPPTIVFHGTNDAVVPYENVQRFDSLMTTYRNDCELVPFHGRDHGFFNPGRNQNTDFNETLYLTDKFLVKHGYLSGNPFVFNLVSDNGLFASPVMSGEPTETSIMLQARLVKSPHQINNDVMGSEGFGYFEVSDSPDFSNTLKTNITKAVKENDFIIKQTIKNLKPGTDYYYRINFSRNQDEFVQDVSKKFRTLQGKEKSDTVSFVMVTGSHYQRFFWNWRTQKNDLGEKPSHEKLSLGFPGHKAVMEIKPDFYIGNGDNVYYDHVNLPGQGIADSLYELRECWHRQFSLPRFQNLLGETAVYWMKDDHDYRFDDADTTSSERFGNLPSHQLGMEAFIEQVPVENPTYRTYRINKDLQIWMLEGRDYRSPNTMPDNEEKTIWGDEQKQWLKETLLKSDAAFKLVISPTPMIGPDDKRKTDNHTNFGGFRTEREDFFNWVKENQLLDKGFYLLCGDRHWQYHSIHPSGIEEFSCGALVDNNSRLGRLPGDPNSTDPKGLIKQPYTQTEASGGFLKTTVYKVEEEPVLTFTFYDEFGRKLHEVTKKQ